MVFGMNNKNGNERSLVAKSWFKNLENVEQNVKCERQLVTLLFQSKTLLYTDIQYKDILKNRIISIRSLSY